MSHPVQLLLHFLLNAVSVLLVSKLLPGFTVRSFLDAIGFAVVVSILNIIVWHGLALLTLPFSVLTLGIGVLIINGLIFLGAQKLVRGVEISGCFIAAIASVLVGLIDWAIMALVK